MHHLDFGFVILDFGFVKFFFQSKIVNLKSKMLVAGVAQLVERQPSKLNVASSSLVSRSKFFENL